MVTANIVLRPKRSANAPEQTAPIAIPTKPILTIQPLSAGVNAQSLTSVVMIKAMIPVSIASNIQPKPTTHSSV